MREANTNLDIILCGQCRTTSHSSHKVDAIIFSLSSHLCISCSTNFISLFSIPCPLLTAFLFKFLPANQSPLANCSLYIFIFNLGICCYHDLNFRNICFTFLFVSPLSSCLSLSLSLSLTLSNLFLIYVPPFLLSSG